MLIKKLSLLECRYPLEYLGNFETNDVNINQIVPLLVRGIQACSHETYIDCPYYEQLSYVGDTRVQVLTTFVMTNDDRLIRRNIDLFDFSRFRWQLVAEHYPSRTPQLSSTFSLLWISMVFDYSQWRGDIAYIKQKMIGVRAVLEQFRNLLDSAGLLGFLPAWSFVDWVDSWEFGKVPTDNSGVSSFNNLLFVQSLKQTAEIEAYIGEYDLAQRNLFLADKIKEKVIDLFWDEEKALFADDLGHKFFSEHTQCIALLNDLLKQKEANICFNSLCEMKTISKASIYFTFYLIEVFKKFNRGDLIHNKIKFWIELQEKGLKTPVEQPEPTRSDCHGWGSHPLYHMAASLCGIRPINFGFQKIEIAPSPGPLTKIKCSIPHVKGWIKVNLEFNKAGECYGTISLPPNCQAHFKWRGRVTNIVGLENEEIQIFSR